MSSPTQLSQPFLASDPHMDEDNTIKDFQARDLLPRDLDESPVYDDMDFATDLPDFHYDLALNLDFDAQAPLLHHSARHSKHFSVDGLLTPFLALLLAPFLLNQGSRFNFNHLRNVSLDDRYNPQNQNLASHSMSSHNLSAQNYAPVTGHTHSVSISADPPLGMFTHSVLSSTLHLGDLMPQLLLLASNQLLLDSPYLAMVLTTPARRKKSASISSVNLYTTPLRGQNPSPGLKVGKTPKTHRRTRLKAMEPGSAHMLATIANMKGSGSYNPASQSSQHLGSNPFEMSFISPKLDNSFSDYDATPLATPAKSMAAPQYFTPISQNHSFGGSLVESSSLGLLLGYLPYLSHGGLGAHSMSQGYSGVPVLRRHDTMESIKIEDQEDDACKQLRKAKSFNTFQEPMNKLTRVASLRNFKVEPPPSSGFQGTTPLPFRKSASIDLLLPELMAKDRPSSLKSYPASIDLASITNSGITQASPTATSNGLLPPIAATRSSSSLQHVHSTPSSRSSTMPGSRSGSGSVPTYPTASQIHETSATDEIAKFAEEILNSDLKRPIVVQAEEDVYDPKKKHKCPLCLARFQRPEHVKRHLKSHSTDKPFQCDFPDCGRRFNRKDNLKAHLKKIHKQTS